jgi:hypothetical protein
VEKGEGEREGVGDGEGEEGREGGTGRERPERSESPFAASAMTASVCPRSSPRCSGPRRSHACSPHDAAVICNVRVRACVRACVHSGPAGTKVRSPYDDDVFRDRPTDRRIERQQQRERNRERHTYTHRGEGAAVLKTTTPCMVYYTILYCIIDTYTIIEGNLSATEERVAAHGEVVDGPQRHAAPAPRNMLLFRMLYYSVLYCNILYM